MARRRMIEVTIAHDKVLNSLSEFAQLLYLKILPHTDDYGRFEGDPVVVKARVDPLGTRKVADYERAMHQIASSGLWMWFKTDSGRFVLQLKSETFTRINAFLIKQRGNAEYPEYMDSYELISSDMAPYHIESNKYKAKSKEQKEGRVASKAETLQEVESLFAERKYPKGEAEKFWHYYEANGWRVGKNPMKDWKAAAAGWVMRSKEYGITKRGSVLTEQPRQRSTYVCSLCNTQHRVSEPCPPKHGAMELVNYLAQEKRVK